MNMIQVLRFIVMASLLPLLLACALNSEPQPTSNESPAVTEPAARTVTPEQEQAAAASAYEILFEKIYVTGKTQVPRVLIRTSDGGYAFAGYLDMTATAEQVVPSRRRFALWLNKVDRAGTLQWERVLTSKVVGGSRKDEAFTVVEARDRALIVAGGASSDDITGRPMGIDDDPASPARITAGLIVCYDKSGAERWRKILGNFQKLSANAFLASVAVPGGYVLAGITTIHPPSEEEPGARRKRVLWLVKIDDAGELLWERKFEDLEIEADFLAPKLIPETDGGVVLALSSPGSTASIAPAGPKGAHAQSPTGANIQQVVVARFDEAGRESKRTAFTMLTRTPLIAGNADGYLVAGHLRNTWYAMLDKDLKLRSKEIAPESVRLTGLIPEADGFRGAGGSIAPSFVYVSSDGRWRVEPAAPYVDLSRIDDIVSGDKAGEFAYLWHDFERRETRLIKMRPKKN